MITFRGGGIRRVKADLDGLGNNFTQNPGASFLGRYSHHQGGQAVYFHQVQNRKDVRLSAKSTLTVAIISVSRERPPAQSQLP
jgi:hypothetical protein